jgi:hypothetical protein
VLNHLHLWDVFDAGVGDAELHKLARIIAHSWQAAARAKFPERSFEVSVSSNGEDYGPTVYMRSANPVGASDPRLSAASV